MAGGQSAHPRRWRWWRRPEVAQARRKPASQALASVRAIDTGVAPLDRRGMHHRSRVDKGDVAIGVRRGAAHDGHRRDSGRAAFGVGETVVIGEGLVRPGCWMRDPVTTTSCTSLGRFQTRDGFGDRCFEQRRRQIGEATRSQDRRWGDRRLHQRRRRGGSRLAARTARGAGVVEFTTARLRHGRLVRFHRRDARDGSADRTARRSARPGPRHRRRRASCCAARTRGGRAAGHSGRLRRNGLGPGTGRAAAIGAAAATPLKGTASSCTAASKRARRAARTASSLENSLGLDVGLRRSDRAFRGQTWSDLSSASARRERSSAHSATGSWRFPRPRR